DDRLSAEDGDELPIAAAPRVLSLEALAETTTDAWVNDVDRGAQRSPPRSRISEHDRLRLFGVGRDALCDRRACGGRGFVVRFAERVHVEVAPHVLRVRAHVLDE